MSFIVSKLETPLQIYIGKDFSKSLTILDSDGSPRDLTNYTFKAQIRNCKSNVNSIVTFQSPTSIDISNAANGEIILVLTDIETSTLQEINAVFDLQWTTEAGIINSIVEGNAQIIETITK